MADQTKTLTLKLNTELTGEQAFRVVNNLAKELNVTLSQFQTVLTNVGTDEEQFNQIVKLTSNNLHQLEGALHAVTTATIANEEALAKAREGAKVTYDPLKDRQKEHAEYYALEKLMEESHTRMVEEQNAIRNFNINASLQNRKITYLSELNIMFEEAEALEKQYYSNIAIYEAMDARQHKEWADQKLFADKAYVNSRAVMYAAMFDDIANLEASKTKVKSDRSTIISTDFKKIQDKAKESLAIELAIQTEGVNSITAIRLKAKQKEVSIVEDANKKFTTLQQQFADGEINWMTAMKQGNAILADKNEKLLKLNKTTQDNINLNKNAGSTKVLSTEAETAKAKAQADYARQRIADEETLATKLRNIELQQIRNAAELTTQKLAAHAEYAAMAVVQEAELYNKTRQIELNALRLDIEERNANYTARLSAQATYNQQAIAQEETLATRLRQIELNALRAVIEERNALDQQRVQTQTSYAREASQQEETLANANRARELSALRSSIEEQHTLRMSRFDTAMTEQEARMRSSVAIQTAEQVHGIASIQAVRARAAETQRQAERTYQAQLASIRTSVATGGVSSEVGANALTEATRRHTAATLTNNAALREQETILARNVQHHRNLFTRVGELIGVYQIWNTLLMGTKSALLAIPQAGIAFQATQANLLGIFGTEEGGKNLKFLSDLADTAGQSLTTLEQAYGRYAPSAALAGAKQDAINKSFKEFAEVGTILHLPEDKINSLFLALDQMFAKGVVQSEEIKKQLGNVLPGAVEIGAKAMEKSPADFMKAMSKNLVTAEEFVPKFAAMYRQIFGGVDDAVFLQVKDRLLSNLQRIQTEYTRINRAIFASTEIMMNDIVKAVANGLTEVRANLTGIGQAVEILVGLIAVRLGVGLLTGLSNIAGMITKLGAAMTILTGLSNPVALGLAAITAATIGVYASLNNLSVGYEAATGFTVKFKEQQVSLTTYLRAFVSVTLADFKRGVDAIFGDTSKMTFFGAKFETVFAGFIHPIDTAKQAIFQFIAAKNALFETDAMKEPQSFTQKYTEKLAALMEEDAKTVGSFNTAVMLEAQKIEIDNLIESFQGKSAILVSDAIKAGKLKTNEDITRALAVTSDIPGQETSVIPTREQTANSIKAQEKGFTDLVAKEKAALAQRLKEYEVHMNGVLFQLDREKATIEFNQQNLADPSKILSQNELYQAQVDIIHRKYEAQQNALTLELRSMAATEKSIQLEATRLTQYEKIALTASNIDKATKIIFEKETAAGKSKDLVSTSGAIGPMQVLPSTLRQPANIPAFVPSGGEAIPTPKFTKLGDTKVLTKQSEVELQAFAEKYSEDLKKFGEDYFKGLVKQLGSIEKAVAAYGDQTDAYMQDFQKKFTGQGVSKIESKAALLEVKDDTKQLEIQAKLNASRLEGKAAEEDLMNSFRLNAIQTTRDLQSVNIEYLTAIGETEQAAQLQWAESHKERLIILEVEARLGNEDAKRALEQLRTAEKYNLAKIATDKILKDISNRQATLHAIENRTDIDVNTGMISQTNAMDKLILARNEFVRLGEEELKNIDRQNLSQETKLALLEAERNLKAVKYQGAGAANDILKENNPFAQALATGQARQAKLKQGQTAEKARADEDMSGIGPLNIEAQHQAIADKKLAIDEKYAAASATVNLSMYGAMAGAGAEYASSLTSMMAKMYGANSKQAKIAFIAYKAMKSAEIIMDTASNAIKAYQSMLFIPYVGPVLGAAAAAVVVAYGAMQLATVNSAPMPAAHGGLTNVPKEQTYLLDKGERVLSPNQNKDLTNYMNQSNMGGKGGSQNIRIINAVDPNLFNEYLGSNEGEKVVMNIVRRNKEGSYI